MKNTKELEDSRHFHGSSPRLSHGGMYRTLSGHRKRDIPGSGSGRSRSATEPTLRGRACRSLSTPRPFRLPTLAATEHEPVQPAEHPLGTVQILGDGRMDPRQKAPPDELAAG
jgi:hypothetical protein